MATTSLSGILNLPKLEQVFGQLLNRIAQQDAEITWLREQFEKAEISNRLSEVEARVRIVERQCEVPGLSSGAGRCALENREAIGRLADALEGKVGREEMSKSVETIERESAARVETVRASCAPLEYAKRVDESCRALSDRLAVAESAVANKVDKSQESSLMSACERLLTADQTLAACGARLDAHDAALIACARREDELAEAAEVNAVVTSAQRVSLAYESEEARRFVSEKFRDEYRRVEASIDGLVDRCDRTEDLCRGLVSATRADLANAARNLEREVESANRVAQARDASCRQQIAKEIEALRTLHVEDIRRTVGTLQAGYDSTKRSVDLALSFVDWFTHRGEAYEHNLTAIDRTLSGMVLKDRTKVAQDP